MPPKPRSNLSLTNLANTYLGFQENQRQQESHDLDQEVTRAAQKRLEQEQAVADAAEVMHLGRTAGWDSPATLQLLKERGPRWGIHGLAIGESGLPTFTDMKGNPVWEPTQEQIDNITRMRQAEMRRTVDTGDTVRETYATEGVGRSFAKRPPPKSFLDEEVLRAQIGSARAQTQRHLASARQSGKYGFEDFQRFAQGLLRYDEFSGEPLPQNAMILAAYSDAIRRSPGNPLKAAEMFSESLVERGEGAGGTPAPTTSALINRHSGRGTPPPTEDAPPPPRGEVQAPREGNEGYVPGHGPPPWERTEHEQSPETEADRVSSRITELEQRRSDPSMLQRGFDWMRPEVIVGEEQEERSREEQELRQRYYDLTGESHEESQLKQTMVRLTEKFAKQAANPELADAAAQTRQQIADLVGAINAEHQRAVATYGEGRADVAGAPAPAKGSAHGGAVRPRHRGAGLRAPRGGTVDMMAGTEIPEGTETRVRNLRRGVDESLGLGIRVLPGREF